MSSGRGKNPGLSDSPQQPASGASGNTGASGASYESGATGASGTTRTTQQAGSGSTSAGPPSQRRASSSVAAQDSSSGYDPSYSRGTQARYGDEVTAGGETAYYGSLLGATLMILSGLLAFFAGLSAVIRPSYYYHYSHAVAHYTYAWNIRGWGWAMLILGALVFAAGVCVMLVMTWARMVGVGLGVLLAIGAFMWLPYSPVWAIIIVALSVFVIWSLIHQSVRDADASY
jgi:hypothetical protein